MTMNGETAAQKEPHTIFDTILILDFGSQYSHLITRKLRELNVYSEMLPCTQKVSQLNWSPRGVILSGGPYSVYDSDAPHFDPALLDLNVPVLGICYGMQEIAWHYGKQVSADEKREYGHAIVSITRQSNASSIADQLFEGLGHELSVWMSHGDKLSRLPDDFVTIASTENAPFAGIAHAAKPYYGIQFHPEVTHTSKGSVILKNFAVNICGARPEWAMSKFVDQEILRIRQLVGESGQVIGAVSGGVDSSVAAKLMQQAIGDRFHAVLVDNGLLRMDEANVVKETLGMHLGVNLTVVDASDLFISRLKGITDPEKKRKLIGNTFIEVFQSKAKEIAEAAKGSPREGDIEWLLQGTLYPDVIESISFKGPSATIKTHHNVGGLLAGMHLQLIEPLRELFKDEVRVLGKQLGIPDELVYRHPFPGPGLGIRILGEVTHDQLGILRKADKIFMDEIWAEEDLYRKIDQALVGLLPVKAVGVMGDKRTYEQVVALRAVNTTDFMTATWYEFEPSFLRKVANRIVNEVDGVCRVFQDLTSKPPGTIEFE